jgi:hypothetical protein
MTVVRKVTCALSALLFHAEKLPQNIKESPNSRGQCYAHYFCRFSPIVLEIFLKASFININLCTHVWLYIICTNLQNNSYFLGGKFFITLAHLLLHDVQPCVEGLCEPLVKGVEEDRLPLERHQLQPVLPELAKGQAHLEQVECLRGILNFTPGSQG